MKYEIVLIVSQNLQYMVGTELIVLKGNKDGWIDFMYKVKKSRKQVWEVLEHSSKIH